MPQHGVMPKPHDTEYAAALDELDRRKSQGTISPSNYDLHRTKLLAEASRQPRGLGVQILIVAGVCVVALLLLRVLGTLFG